MRERLLARVLDGWDPERIAARIRERRRDKDVHRRMGAQRAARPTNSLATRCPSTTGSIPVADEHARSTTRGRGSGLGCASLGTPPPALDDDDAEAVIAAAIERGIRFFDVAPLYGGGLAEERLGRALRGAAARRVHAVHEDRRHAAVRRAGDAARRARAAASSTAGITARAATRGSIAGEPRGASRTDRLDVVHLHDVEDHLDTCLERPRGARTRCATKASSARSASARTCRSRSPRCSTARAFDAFLLAGCYTLLDAVGRALIAAAHARGMRVVAGGVFNSGVLAAWPQRDRRSATSPRRLRSRAHRAHRVPSASDTACRSAAAALQFVLANPAITTVLIGPRTVAELDANLAAAECAIPAALWADLAPANARWRPQELGVRKRRDYGAVGRCESTLTCISGSRPAASTTGPIADNAAYRRDFMPADVAPDLDAAGIDGAILVQTAPQTAETDWLVDLAANEDRIYGLTGWVDLTGANATTVRCSRGPKSSAFARSCDASPTMPSSPHPTSSRISMPHFVQGSA